MLRHPLETGIGHRLATASLTLRIGDIEPVVFQEFIRCHRYLRVKGVNVTGDKQTDLHFLYIFFFESTKLRKYFRRPS